MFMIAYCELKQTRRRKPSKRSGAIRSTVNCIDVRVFADTVHSTRCFTHCAHFRVFASLSSWAFIYRYSFATLMSTPTIWLYCTTCLVTLT